MNKSQGEIFGIALMFVVIIIGLLVYAQIKALNPNRGEDLQQEGEYKLLAESTLNSITQLSTGCYVERGSDSVKNLINYCMEYSFSNRDPQYTCDFSQSPISACSYSIQMLNETLYSLFNSSKVGPIPFKMTIEVPDNSRSMLNNITLTNFGQFKFRNEILTEENYRDLGFKRAPSGLKTWATAQRNINFELFLYYR